MRQRPELQVRFVPARAAPGQVLEVHARFLSRARTPVAGLEFRLRGTETFHTGLAPAGTTHEHAHVELEARYPPAVFTAGAHEYLVRFPLPAGAPPTFRGARARVEYQLDVHVRIPWWPDLRARFEVPVGAAPRNDLPPAPGLFTTSSGGPQARGLYAEAAVASVYVDAGATLRGAVAVVNARAAGVRGITAALVAREKLCLDEQEEAETVVATRRYAAPVCAGAPADDAASGFALAVPADAPVSYHGVYSSLLWELEVEIDAGWNGKTSLTIPLTVLTATEATARRGAEDAPPLVGRARRLALWAHVADHAGLAYDPSTETLRGTAGQTSVLIAVEHRAEPPHFLVARLAGPHLGMDLEVCAARWNDRFSPDEIDLGDPGFDARFRVRGRVVAQVRALLGDGVRSALRAFAEVTIGDDGATLGRGGSGVDAGDLAGFVAQALAAARALDAARAGVSCPPAMAAHVNAWRAFGARIGARFEPGRVWLHDGAYHAERVELGTRWTRRGDFDATVVRVWLAPPLTRVVDPLASDTTLSAAARAIAAELARDARRVQLGPDAVHVELDKLVSAPTSLEPLLERMVRLARALRGEGRAGPYR